ncbi:hypothetical protein DH2020_041748 [Rehmannia glutinosa]|uniref:Non-specific lipid-transfer protein n=1 Tax=Rehmannia glutinosa TaxID=99300 RepID=A0ABR0UQR6_REHGL
MLILRNVQSLHSPYTSKALPCYSSPTGPAKATSCTAALEYLMPCQPYLMGIGEITPTCCQGVQALANATVTSADRKSVCECLKQAALSVNINQDKANQLPKLCNVDVPVPVQPNVNCDA